MPPRKKIAIGGLTKLSSDYSATIDIVEDPVVPPPAATPALVLKPKKKRMKHDANTKKITT